MAQPQHFFMNMKKYKFFICVFLFISNYSFAEATASECYFDNTLGGPWSIYGGNSKIQISNSIPTGTVLAARGITVFGVYTGKPGGPDIVRIKGSWISGGVGGDLADYHTVATNIPGIGLRWRYSSSSTPDGILLRNATPIILAEEAAKTSAVGTGSIQLSTIQELILTGNTSGGIVSSTPGAATNFIIDAIDSAGIVSRSCNATGDFGDKYTLDLGNVQVQNICEIETPSIQVRMGYFSTTDFPSINSPSLQGGTQFSIRLNNCTAEAKPRIYFIDINNRSNTSDLLTLSPTTELGAPSAQGVSIRLRLISSNKIINFGTNNSYSMGSVFGNMVEMPLQADYIRTGTVTAGHANAAAEFFIDYP
ncbi:fimbrial protein [Aquitalea pelogenes]|uniref:fimbrial protein n=1 Tax=Aquitalea pelogenes TaxID=1293573 RepID=UPI0009E991B3|nr:fimbrial protein [Aquitalea pelogenes]